MASSLDKFLIVTGKCYFDLEISISSLETAIIRHPAKLGFMVQDYEKRYLS